MKTKNQLLGIFACMSLALSGCMLTEEEKERLNDAQIDLEQLADQIIITYPANGSVATDSVVTVRADIPEAAEAQEVTLFVDGVEVSKDSDGAPWEISWPSYYWADGGVHSLLLKTITGAGNEVRNNQQFQVTVDAAANSALQFKDGFDGAVFKDTNTVLVEFDEFPGATSYELVYSNADASNTLETLSGSVEIADLEVGIFEVRYRAISEYSGSTALIGPWSDSATFEIASPDLPALNPPVVTESADGHVLSLSWESLGDGSTYKVYLNNLTNNSELEYSDITGNFLEIPGLYIGQYEWQLQRVNSFGHESLLSDAEVVDVGTFSIHLGGSNDDLAQQIISSRDGGYIILGYTKSYEISEAVDSEGDDWIIKLDDRGNIDWQYISSASGRDRFGDIIELSDGSVVVVGQDWASQKAVALKLDESGNKLWEIFYRPDDISERFDFLDVVELSDTLYVSSAEWGPGGCSGCTTMVNHYLHTMSLLNGDVSTPIDIPSLPGLIITRVGELERTSTGDLLISGYAMPEGGDPDDLFAGGVYLQVLDSTLAPIATWDNVGSSMHVNMGDVIELSNGNFAVIGQSEYGGYAITVVSSSGTELKKHTGDSSFYYNTANTIVSGDNGEIYGLFKDSDVYEYPYPLTFVSLNSNLALESQSYLLGYKDHVSPSGLVRNDNGTFTLLFGEGQSGYDNYDIVIVKAVMN